MLKKINQTSSSTETDDVVSPSFVGSLTSRIIVLEENQKSDSAKIDSLKEHSSLSNVFMIGAVIVIVIAIWQVSVDLSRNNDVDDKLAKFKEEYFDKNLVTENLVSCIKNANYFNQIKNCLER